MLVVITIVRYSCMYTYCLIQFNTHERVFCFSLPQHIVSSSSFVLDRSTAFVVIRKPLKGHQIPKSYWNKQSNSKARSLVRPEELKKGRSKSDVKSSHLNGRHGSTCRDNRSSKGNRKSVGTDADSASHTDTACGNETMSWRVGSYDAGDVVFFDSTTVSTCFSNVCRVDFYSL